MIFGIPLLIFQQAWNITRGIYAKYHYKSCYLNTYSNYIGYTKRLCRWPVVRAWQNGHTRTLLPILHTSSVPGARPEADTFLSCPQCGELSINCYIFRPFFTLLRLLVLTSWIMDLWYLAMIHVYINSVMVGKFLSGKLKFMRWFVLAALTSLATSSCFWILEFTAHSWTNYEFEKTWCKIAGSPEIPLTASFYAQRNLIPINSDQTKGPVSVSRVWSWSYGSSANHDFGHEKATCHRCTCDSVLNI